MLSLWLKGIEDEPIKVSEVPHLTCRQSSRLVSPFERVFYEAAETLFSMSSLFFLATVASNSTSCNPGLG